MFVRSVVTVLRSVADEAQVQAIPVLTSESVSARHGRRGSFPAYRRKGVVLARAHVVLFVGHVAAVVDAVAHPLFSNASAILALELVRLAIDAGLFVLSVRALSCTVADRLSRHAFGSVTALVFLVVASVLCRVRFAAVQFVRRVAAVVVAVAF